MTDRGNEMMKIENRDDLDELDRLGKEALNDDKLMGLVLNGATLMSVKKDILRGIIRALVAEVERLKREYDEQDNAQHKLFMAYCEQKKQIAMLKKALLESVKCFNCSRCSYGRGKDCGKRPHENCADVFIHKAQEAHEMQEVEK